MSIQVERRVWTTALDNPRDCADIRLVLQRVAGKDASKQFWKYHGDGVLKKYGPKLKIGDLAESAKL